MDIPALLPPAFTGYVLVDSLRQLWRLCVHSMIGISLLVRLQINHVDNNDEFSVWLDNQSDL